MSICPFISCVLLMLYISCYFLLYYSFIHFGHFYSAPSSPLLLIGALDYSTDTVSEFHAKAHSQLQVKDLPKVPRVRVEPKGIDLTSVPPTPHKAENY